MSATPKAPNVAQHFDGGEILRQVVARLSVYANSFDVTGNEVMAGRLDEIASSIHIAQRKMQRAFVAEVKRVEVEIEEE